MTEMTARLALSGQLRGSLLLLAPLALLASACDDSSTSAPRFDVLIEASATRLNAPSSVQFEASNNGPLDGDYTYEWRFGADEGAPTSAEPAPSQAFSEPGSVEVSLLITETQSGAQGEASVTLEVLPEVNLALSSLSLAEAGPFAAGEPITLSWLLSQEGEEVVRAWSSEVFLVPAQEDGRALALDPSLPESGSWLSAQRSLIEVGALPVAEGSQGGQRAVELALTLPTDLSSGEYFLGVYLDAEGAAGDSERADNLALTPVPLRVRNPLETGPDLQVCGVDVPAFASLESGQRPLLPQGEQLVVSLCLANAGDRPVIDSPYALYLSQDTTLDDEDQLLARGADQALGPNDRLTRSLTIDLPLDTTPGLYRLIAVVDPADGVAEQSESNNERVGAVPFEVVEPSAVEGVDLVVGALSVNEERVYWGQLLTGSLTVQNRGTVAVERLFVARFNALPVSGGAPVQLPSLNLTGVGAGEAVELPFELSLTRRLPEGEYLLQVELDPTNSTGDVNPGNNRRSFSRELTLGGEPNFDPSARSVELSAMSVEAGGELEATLVVSNLGADPTGSFEALVQLSADGRVDLNDPEVARVNIESLAGGEERSVSVTLSIPQDLDQQVELWRVALTLDPAQRLSGEQSEANNQLITEPLLTVTGATGGCGEDEYEENDAPAQAALLSAGLYEGLGVCDEADWFATEVGAGELFELRLSWALEEGAPLLELADSGGQPVLSAERRGDELAFSLPAREQPYRALYRVSGGGARLGYSLSSATPERAAGVDVRLSALSATPSVVESGSIIDLSLLAAHMGASGVASGSVRVALTRAPLPSDVFDDGALNTELGQVELPSLSAGASLQLTARLTLPQGLSDGLYYLVAELEGEAHTAESWAWATTALRVDEARACTTDELEPNGSPYEPEGVSLSARELSSGEYQDLYTCAGDDDWYRVRVEEGEALSAQIDFNRLEGDLDLALYAPDGQELLDVSETLQGSELVELFRASESGDYLVRVYLNPNDELNVSTRYNLTLAVGPSQSCGDDGFEPNATPEEASPLPDGTHELTVCPGGEDWFRLNLPAGNTVSLQVDAGIGDVELALFDPDQLLVETSQRRVTHEAVISGAHLLRVTPTAQDAPAPYTLTVSGVSGVDLALSELTLTSVSGGPGDELIGRVRVSNLRGDNATNVRLRFTLSQDARPTGDDLLLGEQVLPLVEGASSLLAQQRLTIPAAALTGPQQLIVEVDPLRALPDIRTSNNVTRATFEVVGECIDDDERTNEGPSSATPLLSESGSLEAVICAYTEDWYALSAPAGALRVNASVAQGAGDLDVSVYRADDGSLVSASAAEGAPSPLTLMLAAPTELLIQVDGFLDARGSYTLSWGAP